MKQTLPLDETVWQLAKILEYEKQQLLSGGYSKLEKISNAKIYHLKLLDAHISSLNNNAALAQFTSDIDHVKKLAKENETLLQSAKYGVTAAQRRITAIKNAESIVGTYTQDGDKLRTQDAAITRRKIA
jgi:flagellar biosynthesis/type III secretory pathway chaperone